MILEHCSRASCVQIIEALRDRVAELTAVLEERDDMILSQAEGLAALTKERSEPVASAQFHQWAIEEHRKLSAAPITPDPNCTCDEHGACAYCWNGKKHDGYSDGMTAEDDKAFNRQWDVK